ncbi:CDP-glycerol glycerophosphotransferase family protein [Lederbergia citrea]|uniref:CDP-glycerol glycerophosphotransferase family protein n=1 Tax=Lederbergia citrea TaxID=2833581 RepID=UPI001BCA3218|nr:CDP-glycerol glycerophosphotransferase family protein [Lederbergia citrea]MBS4179145.1 CDP-glycerol glycerophosphotransferase family protein [Lederbergia citrea]
MNRLVGKLKKYVSLTIICFFNCFPIKKNKIFFFSYYGSQYGCNPKYIAEYMIQNMPKNHFDIVWAFNDLKKYENIPYIRKVKTMSIKYFYELSTSKIVITNFRATELFVKRKNQYYIQTWHSSLRLKHIEKDAEASLPNTYVQMAKKDSKKCDLLLSGCKYSTDIFKRSFWYDGEIFEHGTPRNDFLFKNNFTLKEKVFDDLNLPIDYKIMLYAPTFRKDEILTVYDLDYSGILTSLENKFGGKWVILVKLHPHLLSKSTNIVYGNHVVDITHYSDIQELLSISDVLISDYSSLIFDFSITKRPCFLYVPDIEEYIKQDRNLYFDILELPFPAAMNNSDLNKDIKVFNSEKYITDLDKFFMKIGSFEDGKASENLVQRINKICYSEIRREVNEAV